MSQRQYSNTWYDLSQTDASYTHVVCRWGAGLAATSKALAALFERMADYQVEATRDMARLAKDPSRAAEAYTAYASRMMQMQAEMQGAVEKITRDADLLYENIRRGIDEETPAPLTSPMGAAVVEPSMKYGNALSLRPEGPGDWRFNPEQKLTSYDGGASAIPPLPVMGAPVPANYAAPSLATMAPQTIYPPEKMPGATSPLSAETALPFPPAPPIPPAPQSGYVASAECVDGAKGNSYRGDGYRRVARAKP